MNTNDLIKRLPHSPAPAANWRGGFAAAGLIGFCAASALLVLSSGTRPDLLDAWAPTSLKVAFGRCNDALTLPNAIPARFQLVEVIERIRLLWFMHHVSPFENSPDRAEDLAGLSCAAVRCSLALCCSFEPVEFKDQVRSLDVEKWRSPEGSRCKQLLCSITILLSRSVRSRPFLAVLSERPLHSELLPIKCLLCRCSTLLGFKARIDPAPNFGGHLNGLVHRLPVAEVWKWPDYESPGNTPHLLLHDPDLGPCGVYPQCQACCSIRGVAQDVVPLRRESGGLRNRIREWDSGVLRRFDWRLRLHCWPAPQWAKFGRLTVHRRCARRYIHPAGAGQYPRPARSQSPGLRCPL